MKAIIITEIYNKEYFEADASYFIEQAYEYGYTVGEDFDFSMRKTEDGCLEMTIFEKGATLSIRNEYIEFVDGYILRDYTIRNTDIKNLIIIL